MLIIRFFFEGMQYNYYNNQDILDFLYQGKKQQQLDKQIKLSQGIKIKQIKSSKKFALRVRFDLEIFLQKDIIEIKCFAAHMLFDFNPFFKACIVESEITKLCSNFTQDMTI